MESWRTADKRDDYKEKIILRQHLANIFIRSSNNTIISLLVGAVPIIAILTVPEVIGKLVQGTSSLTFEGGCVAAYLVGLFFIILGVTAIGLGLLLIRPIANFGGNLLQFIADKLNGKSKS